MIRLLQHNGRSWHEELRCHTLLVTGEHCLAPRVLLQGVFPGLLADAEKSFTAILTIVAAKALSSYPICVMNRTAAGERLSGGS